VVYVAFIAGTLTVCAGKAKTTSCPLRRSGRDMVLYLGRSVCGMKLVELAEAVGLNNYGVVAMNAKRYKLWLNKHRAEQSRMKQVLQMLNYEM
jgi:hypothetical protein